MIRQFIVVFSVVCSTLFCSAKEAKFSEDVFPILKQDKSYYNLLKSFEVWEGVIFEELIVKHQRTGESFKHRVFNCRTSMHFVTIKVDVTHEKAKILSITFSNVPGDCCHEPSHIVKMKDDFTITIEDAKRIPHKLNLDEFLKAAKDSGLLK